MCELIFHFYEALNYCCVCMFIESTGVIEDLIKVYVRVSGVIEYSIRLYVHVHVLTSTGVIEDLVRLFVHVLASTGVIEDFIRGPGELGHHFTVVI